MRRVTSWLHVWLESGRRVNPCLMVPSKRDEVREARAAAMTSRKRCAGCELPRWWYAFKKKKKKVEKSKPRFRVNRIPEAGVKDPLSWAQETLVRGMGS